MVFGFLRCFSANGTFFAGAVLEYVFSSAVLALEVSLSLCGAANSVHIIPPKKFCKRQINERKVKNFLRFSNMLCL
jgi:hypothetical protein